MAHALTNAQGWFRDPYAVHEARWFSDGTPTALVRDADREAQDPPPIGPYPAPLDPVTEVERELLDTDGRRYSWDPGSGLDAIWDIFVSSGAD